jgi:c-di-GMP-binding flagellar brake protein YcgR
VPNLFQQEVGPQPPRQITSALEISALLRNLQNARAHVMVSFDQRPHKFQSFIVKIDAAAGTYWLDEMIPRDGDRYASQGEAFRIEAWHEGVQMVWHCSAARPVDLDGAPAYAAGIPAEITYHQKRGAYRAIIHRTLETGIGLVHDKRDLRFTGHLIDISATGCKARISGDQTGQLKPGELYQSSHLDLPETGRLFAAMEIRFARYDEAQNETHVGIAFRQPAPASQRQIDRYVNTLQREARRLEKDDLF